MTFLATKKARLIGKLFQAITGKLGIVSAGSASKLQVIKPEDTEIINIEAILRQFKTTILELFNRLDKSRIESEKFFYRARPIDQGSTARTAYFGVAYNILKYFWLKAEVLQATPTDKNSFFRKHRIFSNI